MHAALKVIAVLLAGEVADPVEGHARALGIECDFDRAFRVARRAVSPEHTLDLMRAGRQRAEALLAANADLHQRLVAALLERGELDAEADQPTASRKAARSSMRRKDKVPPEFADLGMVVAITSFTCDLESGLPVVVKAGEQFKPDHELVKRYGAYYFTDAATPSWELAQMRTRRHHGHHPQ